MFEKIDTMRMARAMTDHAAQRSNIVARNIANADTPGFKARDLEEFSRSYRASAAPDELRSTRARHLSDPFWSGGAPRQTVDSVAVSPNGNSVTLEDEMFKMAEVKREHEMSVSIYRAGLDIMRASIGKR